MRLIDAEALLNKTVKLEAEARKQVANYEPLSDKKPSEWHTWYGVLAERTAFKYDLLDAPTIDAVEVVRCKDCVYCKRFNDVWYLPKKDELLCTLYVETYDTTENDYCSRGERREDGKTY